MESRGDKQPRSNRILPLGRFGANAYQGGTFLRGYIVLSAPHVRLILYKTNNLLFGPTSTQCIFFLAYLQIGKHLRRNTWISASKIPSCYTPFPSFGHNFLRFSFSRRPPHKNSYISDTTSGIEHRTTRQENLLHNSLLRRAKPCQTDVPQIVDTPGKK